VTDVAPRHIGSSARWFVFITVLIDMLGFGLVMPVLPKLIEEISGRDLAGASQLAGWLLFAYGAMQFLFGPTLGNLSDAFGRRPLLLLAVFGLAVDYLFTAFAPNMVWLFAGRIIAGLCGASYVIANAFLTDITLPQDRAKAFGRMGAAFGLGFIIGPAVGGLLGELGPRIPFFAAAIFSIGNFIFGYFALPETLASENRRHFSWARANPVGTLRVFAQYRGVIPLALAMFAYFLASSVYPAIWAFWGIAQFGWSESTIGLTLAAAGISAAVVQGGLTGPAVKLMGERGAVIFGLLAGSIGALGFGVAPGLAVVIVLIVVHSSEGFVHPAMTALMTHAAPADAQGELQGGIASLQSLSMLLGTVFFTQIFGAFMKPGAIIVSTGMAFYVAAALMALTMIGVVTLTRRENANSIPR
jgi:DHA1 family tetracycline resistance protein-like MFS transporter